MSESYRERILPIHPCNGDRIGLIAGWGRFPIVFAKIAQEQGLSVQCMGIEGMVSDELREICDDFRTAPAGRVGRTIRYFQKRGVTQAVMAGKVEKKLLFDPFGIWRLWPDFRALNILLRLVSNKKDDTLLLAVLHEFEKDGIQIRSALDFCPEILVKHGFLTKRHPSTSQWKDIHFGWEMAKKMGDLDIGQTVVVSDTAVIAVEAIEGTNECIKRAYQLAGAELIVCKTSNHKNQKFDLPTIGIETLEITPPHGIKIVAWDAKQTLIVNPDNFIRKAQELNISLWAF